MVNTPKGVGSLEAATNTTDTGETPEGGKADIVTAVAEMKRLRLNLLMPAHPQRITPMNSKSIGARYEPYSFDSSFSTP